MTLPKAVAAATEELAALEQQLQAPVEETPSADGQTETPPAPEPSPEPAPEPTVASSDGPSEVPEEKWEHKYRRLQGKYDAEVPRLHQQVKELQAALQQMQHQIAQAPPPPPPAPDKPAEPERYVSDEDVANYGEDFVDIQRRITLDATRDLRKQVEDLKAQLAQQGSQVQSVSFETRLLQAVPDFREINDDPSWIAWLNEVDPLIRGPRRAVAQQAFSQGDVEAVKSYVDLWRKGQTPAQPAPAVSREQELKRQVQPSRATAAAPTNAQKSYTLAEADAIFNKMQALVAQGRFEEAKRLDAEISTAYAEGRVTA